MKNHAAIFLKSQPCILCKCTNFQQIHQKDKWRYLRCRNCSLVSLYPRPTELSLINNYQDYLPDQVLYIYKWRKMMQPLIDHSADLIEKTVFTKNKNLLDIGCGFGFFLKTMQDRNWHVSGIEIADTGRHFAQEKLGLNVYSQPLAELDFKAHSFDVVTLFYVIEHVTDPPALLKQIHKILKPGGLLLLRWPHSTPIIKILGPFAENLDLYHTPYHLYDFSPATIKFLLNNCGFSQIKTIPGGYTLPDERFRRWSSIISGSCANMLFKITKGRYLLPGTSKTTLSIKP